MPTLEPGPPAERYEQFQKPLQARRGAWLEYRGEPGAYRHLWLRTETGLQSYGQRNVPSTHTAGGLQAAGLGYVARIGQQASAQLRHGSAVPSLLKAPRSSTQRLKSAGQLLPNSAS